MKMTLVILSALILAVTVSAVPPTGPRDGRLRIIDVGESTLEALFYNADTGIRIHADSVSLTLLSMSNDQVLLSGTRPHDSSLMISVMGSSFLQYKTGEQRKVEFIVPESLVDQTKNALAAAKEGRMISQLERDETQAYIARESAFQRLFEQPEMALLENAVTALGDAGIMGYENQGALNFYGVAKALLTAQHKTEEEEEEDEGSTDNEAQYDGGDRHNSARQYISESTRYRGESSRFKRGWWWSDSSSSSDCSNSCLKCPIGSDCRGRCGPGCWWCWSLVCGDCCYHQGCYDHDLCCARSFFSWGCLVPIPFSCSRYNC